MNQFEVWAKQNGIPTNKIENTNNYFYQFTKQFYHCWKSAVKETKTSLTEKLLDIDFQKPDINTQLVKIIEEFIKEEI